jgi:hypothetical protein
MAEALTPAGGEQTAGIDELAAGGEEQPALELASSESAALPSGKVRAYRARFRLAYAVLGLILVAAVAGVVALVLQPGETEGPPWSPWRPDGDATERAQAIADHVGSRYHLQSGSLLVGIQVADAAADIKVEAIAVRAATSSIGSPIQIFPVDDTVVYILCGPGQDCAITEGTPSSERLRLLRREALELALYTFRYVDGKDRVVAFLPPRPGDKPTYALFFERSEFESQLERPLRVTLPSASPPLPDGITPVEVATIDRLTEPIFFRFSFRALDDGRPVLVLDDPDNPPDDATAQSTDSQSQTDTGITTQTEPASGS